MDKKEKKGFWSTLFVPKKNERSCCAPAPQPLTKAREVLVLGPGCARCKETYKIVERVIAENQPDIKLSKIEDIVEIMQYNIMATPAVVVDGTVRIRGHVPSADEVKKVLGI